MLFSIVIPIYNVGKWLVPCLESVRLQTFQDWECWLVDDGSTDGSERVCDEYAERDSRFKVIHQKNQGVSAARNAGIMSAIGEWIWCVDSDDILHPQALEIYKNIIVRNPGYDVLYHDYQRGETISFQSDIKLDNLPLIEDSNDYPEMSAWRCIFKRELCSNVLFQPYIVGEDLLFCVKLFLRAKKVGHLPFALYGYVERQTSIMHNISARAVQDGILWMNEALRIYAHDERKHYLQLYKRRWVQFLFMLPSQIVTSTNKKDLSNLWFENLEQIKDLPLYGWLSVFRWFCLKINNYFMFMRLFIVWFANVVFRAFIGIRRCMCL